MHTDNNCVLLKTLLTSYNVSYLNSTHNEKSVDSFGYSTSNTIQPYIVMGDAVLLKCYQKAKNHTAKWKILGFLLEVKKNTLDSIEIRRSLDVDNCMVDMLEAWLKSNPTNPEEKLDSVLHELQKTLCGAMQCKLGHIHFEKPACEVLCLFLQVMTKLMS